MTISFLSILLLIVVIVGLGILIWWIGQSPMIDATAKAIAKWVLIGVIILIVFFFILSLFGAVHGITIN